MVQVILGTGEWSGGRNLRWLWGEGGGSARLRQGRGLTMTSKLGLEGCNLGCQLVDMLFCGHAEELAWGLQGLSFLLLSGHVQDWELDVWVPVELRWIYEGSLKGNVSLLNAYA